MALTDIEAGRLADNVFNVVGANRNRIINGDMRIDQRNVGAAVTAGGSFPVDRWRIINTTDGSFSAERSTSAPTGFVNSTKVTTTVADATVGATQQFRYQQYIEGTNVSDLGWGTASAKTVTLSFWVRSSVIGTFGGSLVNDGENRSYPFTYSISVADTWEQKSITVAGDTSGTWLTTTGIGLRVNFGLSMGSSFSGPAGAWASAEYNSATGATNLISTLNATWYVTGVQLEVGSVATPFEHRNYGDELARCQRYYYKVQATRSASSAFFGTGFNRSTSSALGVTFFPVQMRVGPSALEQSGTASDYSVNHNNTQEACTSVPAWFESDNFSARTSFTTGTNLTQGQGSILRSASTDAFLAWSAEL